MQFYAFIFIKLLLLEYNQIVQQPVYINLPTLN